MRLALSLLICFPLLLKILLNGFVRLREIEGVLKLIVNRELAPILIVIANITAKVDVLGLVVREDVV